MAEPDKTIRQTDAQAINFARNLINIARFGALGVLSIDRTPHVTRIALATTPTGTPLTLISDLSTHTKALRDNPNCSLLIGEPDTKGDPLTHPRITLTCKAKIVPHSDPRYAELKPTYLAQNPKAKLYIDFSDFNFAIFQIESADLNGGFGKAYQLTATDLAIPSSV